MKTTLPSGSRGRAFKMSRKQLVIGLLAVIAGSVIFVVLWSSGLTGSFPRTGRSPATAADNDDSLDWSNARFNGEKAPSSSPGFLHADQGQNKNAHVDAPALKSADGKSALPVPQTGTVGKAASQPVKRTAATNAAGIRAVARSKPPANAPPGKKAALRATTKKIGYVKPIPWDVAKALAEIETTAWSQKTEKLLLDTINRWAQDDPQAALEYTLDFERHWTRNAAVGNVLTAWSKKSPEEALFWFESAAEVNPALVEGYTRAVFGQLAAWNLNEAMDHVWSLPTDGMKQAAFGTVAAQFIAGGRESDLLNLHASLADGADRNMVADTIIQQLGRYRPAQLGEWIAAFHDANARSRALDTLVSVWSFDQPAAAANWVATQLPEDADRAREIAKVADNWVREDPVGAANWLLSLSPPSPQTDAAVGVLVRTVMKNNPEAAMAWASAVTAPAQRGKLMEEIAAGWVKKDPAGLQNYIRQANLPPEIQTRLLRMIGSP